jgi:hypothetical protein
MRGAEYHQDGLGRTASKIETFRRPALGKDKAEGAPRGVSGPYET